MKSKLASMLIMAVLFTGGFWGDSSAQESCTIYREVFPNQSQGGTPVDTDAYRKPEVFNQGWYGEQHGSHICTGPDQDLQILVNPNPAPPNLDPINSNPQGPLTPNTTGAFYSPVQRAGIYIFTSEYAFYSQVLSEVRLQARNSACGTSGNTNSCTLEQIDQSLMRPAFRINKVWYIADQGQNIQTAAPSPGSWNQYEFNLAGMTFKTASQYSATPEPVCNGDDAYECSVDQFNCLPRQDGTSGLPLPQGVVDAFGIYIIKNFAGEGARATYRIDNFEIVASVPCEDIATGACTIGAGQGAQCRNVSMQTCIESGGTFDPGSPCPAPVPATSPWGLAAFSVLLIASALWFMKRRRAA